MLTISSNIKTRVNKVLELLSPVEAVLVGGAVRDMLMGVMPYDLDFATPCSPRETVDRLTKAGVKANVQSERYQTVVAQTEDGQVEITSYRVDLGDRRDATEPTPSLEQDLLRRDFTVNALALNADGCIIDFHDGLGDLEDGVIRFVGDPLARLREDPLRAIRALRFAGRYGWVLEPATRQALAKYMQDCLKAVSSERLVMELDKVFHSYNVDATMKLFWDFGVIQFMLPELMGADGLIQNPQYHPEGDLWTHLTQVVARVPSDIRWEALLHDIGKPACAERSEDGHYWTFHGHAKVGESLILTEIGPRLRLPQKRIESCAIVARTHMQAHTITTEKGRRKFWAEYGDYIPVIQEVVKADCYKRKDVNSWLFEEPEEPVKPILMGRHLIEKGVSPGPRMGHMLERAFNAQLEEGVTDINALLEIALNEKEV